LRTNKSLYISVHKPAAKWRFAVDQGGTFTDVIGLDPFGNYHALKLLSHSPHYQDASLEGIRRLLGLSSDEPLPKNRIDAIRFGTTAATNALLERKGGRVALFVTKGFKDLLEIGYQNRPGIFQLCIRKPLPLYAMVVEVDERTDCHGEIIRDFNKDIFSRSVRDVDRTRIDSVAVVLMHSWKNPAHELLCERILRQQGFSDIVLSHKTINLIKIVSRGHSTLIDAYLSTALFSFADGIKKEAKDIPISFMQSNGSLSPPDSFTGTKALFSGPAGGVKAVADIAEETGLKGAIGFDMGGTSTDVSRFDGELEKVYEKYIEGLPVLTEMLGINTVAAGGGSILKFDGRKMMVGPESAGSNPGPACYGFDGPLTVTDANLFTGRLLPDYFPKNFGPERNSPLYMRIVKEKICTLAGEINSTLGTAFTSHEIASGFLRIANEKMAIAIREISLSKGFDVREYALVCFGGAGGQHACAIASLLDINTIIIHPLGSVMSAYGIGLAKSSLKTARTILKPYTRDADNYLMAIYREMEKKITAKKILPENAYTIIKEIDLRPKGTETFLTMSYGNFDETVTIFRERYRKLFGFDAADAGLEVVNLRVEIIETTDFFCPYYENKRKPDGNLISVSQQELFYEGNMLQVPVYLRESIPSDIIIKGAACIVDNNSTVIIDPAFQASIDKAGIITMKRISTYHLLSNRHRIGPDPVLLEVFNNLFMSIASEMGFVLQNTSHSVNIKERLDFSCAIFDARGKLVANAPHIPVHLGAMADTVQAILQDKRDTMLPGDAYLCNNPYRGGSHLPDMTVVCPVFSDQGKIIFFTASRGHHADVGGKTPGSMPPFASHIDEEGVLIDDFLLVRNNIFMEDDLREVLTAAKYPARNPGECISDVKAQIASCRKGMKELLQMVVKYGLSTVTDYMHFIQENAEYSVKKALQKFLKNGGAFHSVFEDHLDDGTPLRVAVSINGGTNPPETLRAVIDFTGTGGQHLADNLNAPFSVTRSAVMYVLRTLIHEDIPLNSGCLAPIDILIPEGTLLNPAYPAPVASGNVETSQRIVDVLLGAFGIAAASQGTMNNLLFEVEGETPYYETIAGGAGAVDGCPGASGVQVHMTNTRITDPEILEFRHNGILLEQFTLRQNSGGAGKFSGGNGVVREIKFLKPATVSILSERRVFAPYGIQGGEPGEKGLNIYKKADGNITALTHREVLEVEKDDAIIIQTPGGGGFGQ
jgi:5-oxoprolinase (ATP-hydrolysing)